MESKHTPGPWIIKRTSSAPTGLDAGGILITQANAILQSPENDSAAEANARLIAAAPELLKAIVQLEEFASLALTELTDQDTGWYYQLQAARQAATAAIDAATK
jgi:hypothetical protein